MHASLYDEALGVLDKVVSSSSNSPTSSITQEASLGTDRLESSTQKSKEDESWDISVAKELTQFEEKKVFTQILDLLYKF